MKRVEEILAAIYAAGLEPTQWRYDPKKGKFVIWCQWRSNINDVVGTLPAEFCDAALYRDEIAGRDVARIVFSI